VNWRRFIGPFEQNTADDIYKGIVKSKSTFSVANPSNRTR